MIVAIFGSRCRTWYILIMLRVVSDIGYILAFADERVDDVMGDS